MIWFECLDNALHTHWKVKQTLQFVVYQTYVGVFDIKQGKLYIESPSRSGAILRYLVRFGDFGWKSTNLAISGEIWQFLAVYFIE